MTNDNTANWALLDNSSTKLPLKMFTFNAMRAIIQKFWLISFLSSSSKVVSVFLLAFFTFSISRFLLSHRCVELTTSCLFCISFPQCFLDCRLSLLFRNFFLFLLLLCFSCFFSFLFFFFLSISFSLLFINLCLWLLLFHFFFFVLFTFAFAFLFIVNTKVIHHLLELFILEFLLFLLAQLLYWFRLYKQ